MCFEASSCKRCQVETRSIAVIRVRKPNGLEPCDSQEGGECLSDMDVRETKAN